MVEAANWLEELGLFDFSRAGESLDSLASRTPAQLSELVELNAAEAALVNASTPRDVWGREQFTVLFPVQVVSHDVAFAVLKTNCGPFFEHGTKRVGEIKPWDVFLFAGDMSKFEWLMPSESRDVSQPEWTRPFVQRLLIAYEQFGPALVRLAELQGLLWQAKAVVLSGGSVRDIGSTGSEWRGGV